MVSQAEADLTAKTARATFMFPFFQRH